MTKLSNYNEKGLTQYMEKIYTLSAANRIIYVYIYILIRILPSKIVQIFLTIFSMHLNIIITLKWLKSKNFFKIIIY